MLNQKFDKNNATQTGTYHLATAEEDLFEIQRSNNFEFLIPDTEFLRVGAVDDSDASKITNAQNVVRLSVVSMSLPMFTQGIIEIRRGNNVMKAAGVPTFSDGTLVVNDYIGADTKSVLMAWQALSYDVKTEKVGLMSSYKKDCTLCEYTPDYKLVRTWSLKGCWVSGLTSGEFNMEQNDKKTIQATITFDKAYMEMPDEEVEA